MLPPRTITLCLLSTALLSTLPGSVAQDDASDWIVDEDMTLHGSREVTGDVIVTNGSTLRLEGAELLVGGVLQVEPGATLLAGPRGSTATRIAALDAEKGFWIQVHGHMETHGEPATVIQNLSGEGVSTLIFGDGGIVVNGTADLQDIHVRSGEAGLVVGPAATMVLGNATLEGLGFAAVGTWGNVTLDNVTTSDVGYGVTGRSSCDIRVRHSTIWATAATVHTTGCPANVRHSTLGGSNNGISIGGSGTISISDSQVIDYRRYGIHAMGSADSEVGGRPGVWTDGVLFRPVEAAEPVHPMAASRGVWAVSADLDLRDTTFEGHQSHGIDAQSSSLRMENLRLHRNGGYGIHMAKGAFANDPVEAGDYGSMDDGTANAQGAISHNLVFRVSAVDQERVPLPGISVRIYDASNATVFDSHPEEGGHDHDHGAEEAASTIRVTFDAYAADEGGSPRYLGPFRYVLDHTLGNAPTEGVLPESPGDQVLEIHVDRTAPTGLLSWLGGPVGISSMLFVLAGLLLLVYGLAGESVKKSLAKRRRRD